MTVFRTYRVSSGDSICSPCRYTWQDRIDELIRGAFDACHPCPQRPRWPKFLPPAELCRRRLSGEAWITESVVSVASESSSRNGTQGLGVPVSLTCNAAWRAMRCASTRFCAGPSHCVAAAHTKPAATAATADAGALSNDGPEVRMKIYQDERII